MTVANSPNAEPLPEPRRVLGIAVVGACFAALAALLGAVDASPSPSSLPSLDGPRVVLTLLGMLAAGSALSMRPTLTSAWLIGGATALLGCAGFPASWDSFRLLAGVFAGLAFLGLAIVKLSPRGRLVFGAALISLHFLGILTAITRPSGQPWLLAQLWGRVYRPYLQFAHLDNSFQFFAPDPGVPSELWFCIEFDSPDRDGRFQWVRLPRRSDSRDPLESSYYRQLLIPEMAAQGFYSLALSKSEEAEIKEGRASVPIPKHPGLAESRQFIFPINSVQQLVLPSYVQHVVASQRREGSRIRSLKVYRVMHEYVTPDTFVGALDADGNKTRRISPYDPVTYFPVYLGAFDETGKQVPGPDPMRWWIVPILARAGAPSPAYFREIGDSAYEQSFADYLKIHAGNDGYRKGP